VKDHQERAARALEALKTVGGAEQRNVYDPTLRAALDPLRSHPALEATCVRCGHRLAWWALDADVAYVAATQHRAKPKYRRGGISDLAQPSPRTKPGVQPWIELAESATTTVRLVDVSTPGYPVRLGFVCECNARYTLRNTTRLEQYLNAIQADSGTIRLT
jgi:hypothetical protein